MIRRLALAVGAAALLAMPAAAAAAPGKEAGKPGKPPAVPNATVKIDVGHLHGGKATILDTVPVDGTITPFAPGQRVEATFYLDGHRLLSRKVAVQQGPDETGTFESSVVVKKGGKYAVAAHHAATATLGADST
ncbi:MAG TPA: hypothetical protein VHV53_07200, partial [Solirubrobacterales bacterium]|nr:hypothetical protein [Solirubrobacterales bacterium]